MRLYAFDSNSRHRQIVPYDPIYDRLFQRLKDFIETRLMGIEMIHIGSTAVPDLHGKPMIDTVAVSDATDLRREQQRFESIGFQRRDVWVDRDDKPYVCASLREGEGIYNVNVHICNSASPDRARVVPRTRAAGAGKAVESGEPSASDRQRSLRLKRYASNVSLRSTSRCAVVVAGRCG